MAPWFFARSDIIKSPHRQQGRAVWILLLGLFLAGLVASASGFIYVRHTLTTPLSTGDQLYTINRGQSLKSFLKILKQQGLIDEIYSSLAYAYWNGLTTKIKAGQYRFEDQLTQIDMLDKIVSGDVIRHQFQFIEGWTYKMIRERLATTALLKQELTDKSTDEVMSLLGAPGQHPEGRFFPDTYSFIEGESDLDILKRAYRAMAQVLKEEWETRDSDIPLQTPYEALTLASIVEKETGKASERPLIAGVFVNRLNLNMRLQTDPTVIYGLGDAFDGNLKRKHLKTDNPYNTYTRKGLPPTPIAMPGRMAIRAAVQPETTKSLYFVSRGDGSHKFSVTLDQHNAAVRKYQLNGKNKS